MKKLLLIGIAVAVLSIGIVYATDNTKHIRKYSDQGRSAGYVVNQGLTAVLDADGDQGILTTNRYQLQRKVLVTPLTATSAGVDTVVDQMLTVPSGQTITIEEINLSANVEMNEATDSLYLQIIRFSGSAKATFDTIVASVDVDDGGSAVYADTIFTLTLIDSVLTAGDILYANLMAPGGAISAGEAVALTMKYRLDE